MIDLVGITHTYGGARRVLENVTLTIRRGAMTAITGPSGCGKSTLLFIAGLPLVVASPALADATEDGTKVCAAGETETMVLRGCYGSLYTRGPGESTDVYRGYTTS